MSALTELQSSGADVVVVAIDSDSTENEDDVRAHVERNSFAGRFAVPPQDMLNQMVSEFGPDIITPPSSPVVLLSADQSSARLLPRGLKSVDDLRRELDAGP